MSSRAQSALGARAVEERCRSVVAQFGPHASTCLGLEVRGDDDEGLGRWLVGSCLADPRRGPEQLLRAWRALDARGLCAPDALAASDPVHVEATLAEAGVPKPDASALVLWRASGALLRNHEGSLARLAASADSFEALAMQLSRLAPGLGRATLQRFLQPLREEWSCADALPLESAALAAGVHLGLLQEGEEADEAPAALRRLLRNSDELPRVHDLEAALGVLGRRSCLRERPERCPLEGACPRRSR